MATRSVSSTARPTPPAGAPGRAAVSAAFSSADRCAMASPCAEPPPGRPPDLRYSRVRSLGGRGVAGKAPLDRGERGVGARSVRAAALGEVRPAAPTLAAELSDPGLDQLDRAQAA